MSHQTKSGSILLAAMKSKGNYLTGFLGATAIAIAFTVYSNYTNQLDLLWAKSLDPILGLGTFVLAIIIWFNVVRKEYIQNLPKRLSILYKYEGHPILYYHKAFLSSDKDIRPWAQQLARQANGQNLQFTPFFNRIHEIPIKEKNWIKEMNTPKYYVLYLLEVHLTGGFKISDIKKDQHSGKIPEVIEQKFIQKNKVIQTDTLIVLTIDGGKKMTHVFKTDMDDEGISKEIQMDILDALQH